MPGVREFIIDSLYCRVAVDGFLSELVSCENGFSLRESPLAGCADSAEIIFSELRYRSDLKSLTITKPTISGRPIYYMLGREGEFICATHPSLFRKAGIRLEENPDALPEFFVYRYVMPPRTLYKDIAQVAAGEKIEIEFGSTGWHAVKNESYIPPAGSGFPISCDVSLKTLDLITYSCERLRPLASETTVLLSGGLDSSILYRICGELFGPRKTFSTGYPFESAERNDEKEYALSAAREFGADHEYYEPHVSEYLHGFVQAISEAEEPMHHLQSVLLFLLFRSALRKGREIIVSGEGADGVFDAGFGRNLHDPGNLREFMRLVSGPPFLGLLKTLSRATGRGGRIIRSLYRNSATRAPLEDPEHVLWDLDRHGDMPWARRYFEIKDAGILANRINSMRRFGKRPVFDIISILATTGNTAATQAVWSKLGEACQKVLFFPYTDSRVLDLAYRTNWNVKMCEPKHILRNVARRLSISEQIVSRPKNSFGIDVNRWAARGSIFEPLVSLAAKVFDQKEIRFLQNPAEYSKAVTFWNVLNYAIWKRLCIGGESVSALQGELEESIAIQERHATETNLSTPFEQVRAAS